MFTNEDLFLSEVHIEDCPPGQGEWTTDFTGVCHFLHTSSSDESCDVNGGQSVGVCLAGGSSQAPGLDEDGDLVVPRGKCRNPNCFSWKVQHCRSTTLRDVGTQVGDVAWWDVGIGILEILGIWWDVGSWNRSL